MLGLTYRPPFGPNSRKGAAYYGGIRQIILGPMLAQVHVRQFELRATDGVRVIWQNNEEFDPQYPNPRFQPEIQGDALLIRGHLCLQEPEDSASMPTSGVNFQTSSGKVVTVANDGSLYIDGCWVNMAASDMCELTLEVPQYVQIIDDGVLGSIVIEAPQPPQAEPVPDATEEVYEEPVIPEVPLYIDTREEVAEQPARPRRRFRRS